jgi:RHS repeat-associated protein
MGYDANGNMTTRGADTLSYDSENRLKDMKIYEGESSSTNYTLKPGWNVISFTHLPDNRSVSSILSSLTFGTDYDQVSTWDSSSSSWKHWVNDADFNDFTQFEYGKTYEIYNHSGVDKTFTVTGKTRGTDINHSIVSGDNFISPAVKTATNVTTVLSSLTFGTHYSDVKRFNATTQTWESYASSQFTQFEPGKGYNIIGLTTANFSYGKTEITTTFIYDSTGSRVKKASGSTTTVYLGKDYDITGSTSTKYIFLGDRRISTKKSDGTLEFIHSDHINSSNVITDSSGNQAGMLEYDPYGSTVTHTGSSDPKHKFTGQEEDSSTRLYYYGARYMDPQLGRFITADPTVQHPTDPQDLNRYAYARNNPVNFTDPTGFGWFKKLVAAVIGTVVGVVTTIATGNPALGLAAGVATYRGWDAALHGANIKEIYTAAFNGAGEGLEIYKNPTNAIGLFTKDPRTGDLSPEGRRVLKGILQLMGLDAVSAEFAARGIEGPLTKGNRSYAAITAGTPSVEIKTTLSFSWSNFTVYFRPRSQIGFNIAGFIGANGFEREETGFSLFSLAGLSYDVALEFKNPRSVSGQKSTSAFVSLSRLGGEHSSVSFDFVKTEESKLMLKALAISVGPSMGSPFGVEFKPAKDAFPSISKEERKIEG